ncbi:MAG: hypothetical protein AAGE93_11570 [Bacteroidota bacterium]
MGLTILTLACLLLYVTSKYFPVVGGIQASVIKHKSRVLLIGILLLVISLIAFSQHYDVLTTFIVWLTALMTILSALILTIKISLKWLYGWGALCVLFLIIDFI